MVALHWRAVSGPTHFDRGLDALERGALFEARDALSRAVAEDRFDVAARHNLAVVYRLRGELADCWTNAHAAAALCAPDGTEAAVVRSHLALIERLMDDPKRADEELSLALESDPSHRVSLAYRALFARLDGAIDTAIEYWRRALGNGPHPALPRLVRARIEGMIADAVALGRSSVDAAPRCASAIGAITELLGRDGRASLVDDAALTDGIPREPAAAALGDECSASDAAEIVHHASRIVVLTGAGCSAESGLATRKDLWKRFDKDDAVSITDGSLAMLWRVIEDFLGDEEAQPNPAHDVIASLPRVQAIITQNVDDLHQRAARDDMDPVPIIELHGTLERTLCHSCGASRDARARELLRESQPPKCRSCGRASVRPDVVLFGEWVSRTALEESVRHVSRCDLLLVVGCAMDVAPASELPRIAREHGAAVIEVKRGASRLSKSLETRLLRGTAAMALPALYGELAEREDVLPLNSKPVRDPPRIKRGAGRYVDVVLPAFYESVVEGTIARWSRLPGAQVRANEVLCEVDLDKTTVEVASPATGTLQSIFVGDGQVAQVAGVIARIELQGDETTPADPTVPSEPIRWPIAAPMRKVDPFAGPFGAHTDAARLMLSQIARAAVLQPDATLDRRGDDATRELQDVADELAAALGLDARSSVEVFRDPIEASRTEVDRWLQALERGPLEPMAARWAEFSPVEAKDTRSRDARRAAKLAAKDAIDRGTGRLRGFSTMPEREFTKVACEAVVSVVARGPAAPCRWRPLLALWLRGAWPFALPDALGVWLPTYDRGELVAEYRRYDLPMAARPALASAQWPRSPARWYGLD